MGSGATATVCLLHAEFSVRHGCAWLHGWALGASLIEIDLSDYHFFAATRRHSLAGSLREIDQQYERSTVVSATYPF
jgi:hypothetical protein